MAERRLVWVDTEGNETPAPMPARAYDQVVLSPDGTHAALGIEGDDRIWLADLERGTLDRLPADLGAQEPWVLFFSDYGRRVASSATRDGRQQVVWQAIDGTGEAQPLATLEASIRRISSAALSPDGTQFVPTVVRRSRDLGIVTIGDPESYRDFLAAPTAQEFAAAISPNGRWIAYTSNETGVIQVYVQRFPEGGGRSRASVGRSSSRGNTL